MFFQVTNHKVAITISSFNWIQNVGLASLWSSIIPLTQMNWKDNQRLARRTLCIQLKLEIVIGTLWFISWMNVDSAF